MLEQLANIGGDLEAVRDLLEENGKTVEKERGMPEEVYVDRKWPRLAETRPER